MRVRQVLGSGARRETYTLLDDDGRVVELVDDYLALCTDREHSPNTLRARAYDLKEWLTFLRLLDIAPLAAVPEHVDQFAGWLRRPVGPGQLRPVNADDGPSREATTANRILNSVYMFYEFLARRGVGMGAQLERHRPARRGDHAGFLAGIAERSVRERPTRLKEKKRRPETLSDAEVQQILDACDRLRDRLLMSVMFETGCRIGQALGMRHEDINTDRLTITLQPRENNANRARGKSRDPRQIPVRQALLDLYADYLFGEYGELSCDYVFVTLRNGPAGTPMTYWAAMSLVKRLRRIRPPGSCGRRAGAVVLPPGTGSRRGPSCPRCPMIRSRAGRLRAPCGCRSAIAARPLTCPSARRTGSYRGQGGKRGSRCRLRARQAAWVHRDGKTVSSGDDPSWLLKLPQQRGRPC